MRLFTDLIVATVFLTRLPVGRTLPPDAFNLTRALWAFPLIGAGIGAVGGGIYWLGALAALPPSAAAFLGLGAIILLTGALHEDGFADVADGFGGGTTREQKLEIMKDSRVGAYGVAAMILSIALRAALLSALSPTVGLCFMVLASAASRLAPLVVLRAAPCVSNGLGKMVSAPSRVGFNLAAGLIFVVTLAAWPLYGHASIAVLYLAAVGAAVLVAHLVAWLGRAHIGGYTGDVLGAAVQLSEIAVLALLCSLMGLGVLDR